LFINGVFCAGCSQSLAQPHAIEDANKRFPGRGLRINVIRPGGAAERAGLRTMDLISRYGDVEVVDDASFFSARDSYENSREREIPLVIWRDRKALRVVVPPGKLGVDTVEYSPVAFHFHRYR
jgi:S1-C subfamily serine protease